MKYENLAFLCEATTYQDGFALENTIVNTMLDDVSSLSETEITEAVDTLSYLISNGNIDEPSAQFILGAVSESMDVLFGDDVFALEGKNMDLMYELHPLKKELSRTMKSLKRAMKHGEYDDAKSLCDSTEKILNKMEKVLKDSADDGAVSAIIGMIMGSIPVILRTLAASIIAIPLSYIGLGGVPVFVNRIYSLKESIEITFAELTNMLKNREISWNTANTYKQAAYRVINITKSQLKNYKKTLDSISSSKYEDNDMDPSSTQKLNDAKSSLSDSLHGMTSATKKKK